METIHLMIWIYRTTSRLSCCTCYQSTLKAAHYVSSASSPVFYGREEWYPARWSGCSHSAAQKNGANRSLPSLCPWIFQFIRSFLSKPIKLVFICYTSALFWKRLLPFCSYFWDAFPEGAPEKGKNHNNKKKKAEMLTSMNISKVLLLHMP